MKSLILVLLLAFVSQEIKARSRPLIFIRDRNTQAYHHSGHGIHPVGYGDEQRKIDLDAGQHQLGHKDIGGYGVHKNIGTGYGSPSFGSTGVGATAGSTSFSQSGSTSFSQSGANSFAGGSRGVHDDISRGHHDGFGLHEGNRGIGGGSGIGGLGGISGHGHQSGFPGVGSPGYQTGGYGGRTNGYSGTSGVGNHAVVQSGFVGGHDLGHQTKVDLGHDYQTVGGHGAVSPGHRIDSVGDRYGRRDEEHVRTGSSSFSTSYSNSQASKDIYKDTNHVRRY